MPKDVKIVSDFSGKEVDTDRYYGVTFTNFSTKMSCRFYASHSDFMEMCEKYSLKPEWEPWGSK